jgi:hypothetical protein
VLALAKRKYFAAVDVISRLYSLIALLGEETTHAGENTITPTVLY